MGSSVKILFFMHYCNLINTFRRKGKGPEPDPYLRQLDPDPRPKNMRNLRIRIPNTGLRHSMMLNGTVEVGR